MDRKPNTDSTPVTMPAPQLPNIPMSPDDPFYPDPDRKEPVTPSPETNPEKRKPSSGSGDKQDSEVDTEPDL